MVIFFIIVLKYIFDSFRYSFGYVGIQKHTDVATVNKHLHLLNILYLTAIYNLNKYFLKWLFR